MRIVVLIKQVPDTGAVKMDEKTGTVIRQATDAIINPLDLYAIESALLLKERREAHVTVLSMGPPQAESALREAVAMGCDDAVLLTDRAFAGSDTWSTSHILAAAIRKIGIPDLILCGERATDGDTGQIGPGVAAALELPVATYVNRIGDADGEKITVSRAVEDGVEQLRLAFPAVLTVVKEVASPRLPTLRGKIRAKSAPLATYGQSELALDTALIGLAGSPTRVVKIFRPQVARACVLAKAADEAEILTAVRQLNTFLEARP